jgi:hypothetical protein
VVEIARRLSLLAAGVSLPQTLLAVCTTSLVQGKQGQYRNAEASGRRTLLLFSAHVFVSSTRRYRVTVLTSMRNSPFCAKPVTGQPLSSKMSGNVDGTAADVAGHSDVRFRDGVSEMFWNYCEAFRR